VATVLIVASGAEEPRERSQGQPPEKAGGEPASVMARDQRGS